MNIDILFSGLDKKQIRDVVRVWTRRALMLRQRYIDTGNDRCLNLVRVLEARLALIWDRK